MEALCPLFDGAWAGVHSPRGDFAEGADRQEGDSKKRVEALKNGGLTRVTNDSGCVPAGADVGQARTGVVDVVTSTLRSALAFGFMGAGPGCHPGDAGMRASTLCLQG